MADTKQKRKQNFSAEEVEHLVEGVKKNYHILYGEESKKFINKSYRQQAWLEVLENVNVVSIEKRTLQEIKNKWKKCMYMLRDYDLDSIDAMPLEQRLRTPLEPTPESTLSSQPLSPTKLKVTRQKHPLTPQKSPTPTPTPQEEEVCLRWNSHHVNIQNTFPTLLLREQFVDVTIVANEGRTLKCHKMILSACSPYFEDVLAGITPMQHPVLFMKDTPFWILKSLLDFMYAGEVHIYQNKLQELLDVAEILKIKGLAGSNNSNSTTATDTKLSIINLETEAPPKPSPPAKTDKKRSAESKKDEKPSKKVQNTHKSQQVHITENRTSPYSYRTRRSSSQNSQNSLNEEVLDPLDLLEPVYEEPAKEDRPAPVQRVKEKYHGTPVRRKFKKRKYSEIRAESPPLVLQTRKGTRSRPNIKVPKYYDGLEEEEHHLKKNNQPVIERQPHVNAETPFLTIVDIKTEPMDFDSDVIEIEDNNVDFIEENDEGEEIIGNYDSPILKIAKKITENDDPLSCDNDIGITITNVQSITESEEKTEEVPLNNQETPEIVEKITENHEETPEIEQNPENRQEVVPEIPKVDSIEEKTEEQDTSTPTNKDPEHTPLPDFPAPLENPLNPSELPINDDNHETPSQNEEITPEINENEEITPQNEETMEKSELDFTENIEMSESLTSNLDFDQNLADLTNTALDLHFNTSPETESFEQAPNSLLEQLAEVTEESAVASSAAIPETAATSLVDSLVESTDFAL